MLKILVIEDNRILADLISAYLAHHEFETKIAYNGQNALEMIDSDEYDLIVLDLILPVISGDQILKYLRNTDNKIPVIVITSETSEDSELMSYKNGSSLFHRKPIRSRLLLYQIRSLLKDKLECETIITHKDLTIDTDKQICRIGSATINFSPTEYRTIEYLMCRPDRLITKQELSEYLYSDYDSDKFKNLDTIMFRIRKKLNTEIGSCEFKIRSHKGFGYRI